MIFTGRASEEDKDFDYFGGKIRNAKDKIKEFPIIDNIVNNFIGANKSNCDNNIFLNLASSAFSDPFFQGHPSLSSEFKLKQFEDLLNEILPKLKSDKKEDLKSRLKTLTKKNHLEKIAELNFYRELLENKEISDIYYEDKTKGNHDFSMLLEGIEFNIEVTCLGKGKTGEKLEEAFDLSCNEIIKTINQGDYLKLEVITDKLLENKDDIPEKIKEKIVSEYNKIKPLIFTNRNKSCTLPDKNLGNPEKYLSEVLNYMPYYGEFGEGVLSLSKTKEGLNFLQNTKIKEIINSCFAYFWFMNSKSKKVTIHSQCLWPSNSESSRKESLIKQIKRRINQKIKDGQLRGRKNGIIAFNFEDFIFMNYWDKSNICYQQNLDELTDIIQGCFKDKSEEEILGVLIYYDSLKKSAFIQNPLINIDREIISKIESL